jgi:hypothetical protein
MGPKVCLETSAKKNTIIRCITTQNSEDLTAHVVQLCVSVVILQAMLLSARQNVRRETVTELQINVN